MGDWVSQQLGSYRLTQLLGEGGFARVYLGEHLHLGTLAAIKVLTAKIGQQEIADFLQEARTIARLPSRSGSQITRTGRLARSLLSGCDFAAC